GGPFPHSRPRKEPANCLAGPGFADRMAQHPLDLGFAADAKYRSHDPVQIGGGRHPLARFAFRKAAIKDELDLEPAERGGGFEHLALDAAGAIPSRLTAGRGVECKDQPPASAARVRRWRLL